MNRGRARYPRRPIIREPFDPANSRYGPFDCGSVRVLPIKPPAREFENRPETACPFHRLHRPPLAITDRAAIPARATRLGRGSPGGLPPTETLARRRPRTVKAQSQQPSSGVARWRDHAGGATHLCSQGGAARQ
jgi:hypothetical protein